MSKPKIKLHPDNPRTITDKQLSDLEKWMIKYGDISGVVHNQTTGNVVSGNQRCKIIDIETAEITITEEFKKPTKTGTTAHGYIIHKGERFSYRKVKWTKKKEREALVLANQAGGDFDFEILMEDFSDLPLEDYGFEMGVGESSQGYLESNKEIDVSGFEDSMIIKLNYTEAEYNQVKDGLSKVGQTPEAAVWKLLKEKGLINE